MNSPVVVEIWEIPPDKFRKEVVADDTGDGSEGHIVVMSDSDVRVYDPVSDTVNESEYDDSRLGSDGVTSSDLIDLIFDDAFNVEFEEIATVADRPAYHLSLTPRESADEFYQQYTGVQLWIDQKYAYPLRVNHNMTIQGEELTSEEMFEEVDFDAEFDESIFSLDY